MSKYTYRKDHIPKGTPNERRPGYSMNPTSITIHNTGNTDSSASNERSWLTNPTNNRQASYHIVVDDREAIECLPLNENAWHAGDGGGAKSGNRTSIGIEICESGNYSKTLDNAVSLVASMLKERGWGVDRLKRHFDWSGKICPRLMYDGGKWSGWNDFKNRVAKEMEGTKVAKERDINVVSSWAETAWKDMTDKKYFDGTRPGAPITREEMAIVLSRLINNLSKK